MKNIIFKDGSLIELEVFLNNENVVDLHLLDRQTNEYVRYSFEDETEIEEFISVFENVKNELIKAKNGKGTTLL